MNKFSSPSQKIGQLGEHIACVYLRNKGFHIHERNYTKKWGEIDIVAIRQGVTHFVEVKSVSRGNTYRPEEHMHAYKQRRLMITIQTYMLENPWVIEGDWQCDLLCVYLNSQQKQAQVSLLENIIFSN